MEDEDDQELVNRLTFKPHPCNVPVKCIAARSGDGLMEDEDDQELVV